MNATLPPPEAHAVWIGFSLLVLVGAALPGVVARAAARRLERRFLLQYPERPEILDEAWVRRLHTFSRYTNSAVALYMLAGMAAFVGYLGSPRADAVHRLPAAVAIPLGIAILLAWVFGGLGGVVIALNRLNRTVRGIEATGREQLRLTFTFLGLMIAPVILWVALLTLLSSLQVAWLNSDGAIITLALLFFGISTATLPALLPKLLRARLCSDPVLVRRVASLAARADVVLGAVLIIPWARSRIGNAMVTGLRRPCVMLTDYLIEHFTPDEVDAVLAHEFGHIRLRHLWIRGGLTLLWIPLWFGVAFFLGAYGLPSQPLVMFVTIVALLGLYNNVIVKWLSRRHEDQADRYVLSLGIDPAVFIAALEKLSRLNAVPRTMSRWETMFRTHPSIQSRIDRLKEAAHSAQAG